MDAAVPGHVGTLEHERIGKHCWHVDPTRDSLCDCCDWQCMLGRCHRHPLGRPSCMLPPQFIGSGVCCAASNGLRWHVLLPRMCACVRTDIDCFSALKPHLCACLGEQQPQHACQHCCQCAVHAEWEMQEFQELMYTGYVLRGVVLIHPLCTRCFTDASAAALVVGQERACAAASVGFSYSSGDAPNMHCFGHLAISNSLPT